MQIIRSFSLIHWFCYVSDYNLSFSSLKRLIFSSYKYCSKYGEWKHWNYWDQKTSSIIQLKNNNNNKQKKPTKNKNKFWSTSTLTNKQCFGWIETSVADAKGKKEQCFITSRQVSVILLKLSFSRSPNPHQRAACASDIIHNKGGMVVKLN